MTAATIERDAHFAGRLPAKGTLSALAATKYYKGTLVCFDANSRAAAPAALLRIAGVVVATQDNTLGANDAMLVEVAYGVFGFPWTGTAPKPGQEVFAADNQTLTIVGTGNLPPVGMVTEVIGSLAYVWVNPAVSGLLAFTP